MLDMPPAQPQSSQSTGTLQNKNPYLSTNPFGMPAQQTAVALDQSFQNLSLAPSQTLFPNHTGGAPISQPGNMQQGMYQQTMTPPIPAMPQMYASPTFNNNQISQPSFQTASYNPFFTNQQPQQPPQPLMVNTATLPGAYNPFTRSPTRIQSPTLTQIPEQTQQNFYTAVPQQQPQTQPYAQMQPQMYSQPQPKPLQPQQTNNPFAVQAPVQYQQPAGQPRPDTASIMALYNYPQSAPQSQPQQQQQPQAAPLPTTSAFDQMYGPTHTAQTGQQQTAGSVPASLSPTSKNPFMTANGGATALSNKSKPNISRDSMMAFGMEWSNGRHSPDAFASLSARDMR
jgi:hypothetical protein